MALTETKEVRTTVLPDGRLQVREDDVILRDGNEISRIAHRKVVDVGDDVTAEDPMVQEIATAMHTKARKDARKLVKDAEKAARDAEVV